MKETIDKQWYKAKLLPAAKGLFTPSFYPIPKQRTGTQYVYFTQDSNNISHKKVIVASSFETSGLRIMTADLASKCLSPCAKASKIEMLTLNTISSKLKV